MTCYTQATSAPSVVSELSDLSRGGSAIRACFDDAGGNSNGDGTAREIGAYDGIRSDNCSVSDADALQYGHLCAEPYVVSDTDWCHVLSLQSRRDSGADRSVVMVPNRDELSDQTILSDDHARASRDGAVVTDDGVGPDVDDAARLESEPSVNRAPGSEAHMSWGRHGEAKAPPDVTARPEASARVPKTDHGQTESPAHITRQPDSERVGHRKALAVVRNLQRDLWEAIHGEKRKLAETCSIVTMLCLKAGPDQ